MANLWRVQPSGRATSDLFVRTRAVDPAQQIAASLFFGAGGIVVTGEAFSASVSSSFGAVASVRNVAVSAASFSATVSTSFGAATAKRSTVVTGAALSAGASATFGSVSTVRNAAATGVALAASVGAVYGSIHAGANVAGAALGAAASASYGSVSATKNVTIAGVDLTSSVSIDVGSVVAIGGNKASTVTTLVGVSTRVTTLPNSSYEAEAVVGAASSVNSSAGGSATLGVLAGRG